ncbi:MAG: pullulanase-type alpha-1,6-glucosidase [Ardenticatenaceae bacterium]|nr:pullulanase-type alpha-1,6-glucosidase [Ardenticatenaceae bacterium]
MKQISRFFVLIILTALLIGFTAAQQTNPDGLPAPETVTIAGTVQPLVGCGGEWDPGCESSMLTYDEEDDLWSATFDLPAGSYEYKAALNGGWDDNYGLNGEYYGANIPLEVPEDQTVTFFYSHNTGWVTDNVNSLLANVPGDFQDEIGCPGDWQPDCLLSLLQDPDGDGAYTFQTESIPSGAYEAKVAVNQSWDINYGEAGAQDGGNIPFTVSTDNELVTFSFDSRNNNMTIFVGEGGGIQGNIIEQRANWVSAQTIAWEIEVEPDTSFFFHYHPTGGALSLGADGISGGEAIPLTVVDEGLGEAAAAKFRHLQSYTALALPNDFSRARTALKGQLAVSAQNGAGELINATGLQIPGVIDELYPYDGELGVTIEDGMPTIRLWAPTARSVTFNLFPDGETADSELTQAMRVDPQTGVWSITGDADWIGKYYLFDVEVYVPSEGSVQINRVTDPYSLSLWQNSTRSQIVDLNDASLLPEGWLELEKPAVILPEQIVIYELHIRDFSVNDPSVPDEFKGTYKAFTLPEANGMQHLAALSDAGLTHLHLLPTFDLATIDEDKSNWGGPSFEELSTYPPDSQEQQALISAIRDQDPFNWGYDPFHYTVPEGSYATDPAGSTRIVEFREMVQALNQAGLRVVIDVVYNHTNASGQSDKSVLDRIVPGYYHRLSAAGRVERSTCCDNTATEHDMMRKLMIDSVVTWATAYKVDGFRFDLMGHHMKEDMLAVRAALDALTIEDHGVDGSTIYVYGEGWNFGEVADNARGVNATQVNMAGTGIGTFNDRLRDAVRGGSPFGGQTEQGFVTGLYTDPNDFDQGAEAEQLERLLGFTDQIRVGLAGNLSDFTFISMSGNETTGRDVLYNGSPAGYASDPQENIVYISKHDNETLFDVIQYKAAESVSTADRARMQNLGNALVMFSQGVPFFQAGDDLLRSKSLDRNSYNSGDWFNRLDFTYQSNNWGVGLPSAADNEGVWDLMQPLLANPDLRPTPEDIAFSRDLFRELLQIQRSSPLFSLATAEQVQQRLAFHNTGPDQIPGVIAMSLSDVGGDDLDPDHDMIVVIFNAGPEIQQITEAAVTGFPFELHAVQQSSVDERLIEASFDGENGTFTVPARTAAVFVVGQGEAPVPTETAEPEGAGEEETVTPETAVEDVAEIEDGEESGAVPWGVISGLGILGAAGLGAWWWRRSRS